LRTLLLNGAGFRCLSFLSHSAWFSSSRHERG
jgi:hypothetical protein